MSRTPPTEAPQTDAAEPYNYATFRLSEHTQVFFDFQNRLHVGERAPDAELQDLATGVSVQLSSLWRGGIALLEFGSFT